MRVLFLLGVFRPLCRLAVLIALLVLTIWSIRRDAVFETGLRRCGRIWWNSTAGAIAGPCLPSHKWSPAQQAEFWLRETERICANYVWEASRRLIQEEIRRLREDPSSARAVRESAHDLWRKEVEFRVAAPNLADVAS